MDDLDLGLNIRITPVIETDKATAGVRKLDAEIKKVEQDAKKAADALNKVKVPGIAGLPGAQPGKSGAAGLAAGTGAALATTGKNVEASLASTAIAAGATAVALSKMSGSFDKTVTALETSGRMAKTYRDSLSDLDREIQNTSDHDQDAIQALKQRQAVLQKLIAAEDKRGAKLLEQADAYDTLLRAEKNNQTALQKTRAAINSAGDAIGKFVSNNKLAIGAAAGFAYAVSRIAEGMEMMSNQAKAFGLTYNELQGLRVAAEQSQVSLEELGKGVQGLNKSFEEALVKGAGQGKDAFRDLGISTAELKNVFGDVRGQLEVVANAFATKGLSATEKLSIATELFGDRLAVKLLPFLEEGAAGIDKLVQSADEFNTTLGEDQQENVNKMTKSFDNLGLSWKGLLEQATSFFSPAFTLVSDGLTKALELAGRVIKKFSELGPAIGKNLYDALHPSAGTPIPPGGIPNLEQFPNLLPRSSGIQAPGTGNPPPARIAPEFTEEEVKAIMARRDALIKETDDLNRQYSTQDALIRKAYKDRLEIIKKGVSEDIITKKNGAQLEIAIEREKNDALANLALEESTFGNDAADARREGLISQYDSLVESIDDRTSVEATAYKNRQDLLKSSLDQSLITQQRYEDLSFKLSTKYWASQAGLVADYASQFTSIINQINAIDLQLAQDRVRKLEEPYKQAVDKYEVYQDQVQRLEDLYQKTGDARIKDQLENIAKERDAQAELVNSRWEAVQKADEAAKRQFESNKKWQRLQVIVNTASAIARAYADFPYYVAVPISLAIAALGAKQLQAINAASYTSTGAAASQGSNLSANVTKIKERPADQSAPNITYVTVLLDGKEIGASAVDVIKDKINNKDEVIFNNNSRQMRRTR